MNFSDLIHDFSNDDDDDDDVDDNVFLGRDNDLAFHQSEKYNNNNKHNK